jgi:hypothetical protein
MVSCVIRREATMVWKRFIMLAVVVLVLPMVLVAGYSGRNVYANPEAPDEIVVRISSKGVTVTDPDGNEIKAIPVDPKDPMGSLARRMGSDKPVKLIRGGAPQEFSFEASPECTCRCEGGECRCRPDGCVP